MEDTTDKQGRCNHNEECLGYWSSALGGKRMHPHSLSVYSCLSS